MEEKGWYVVHTYSGFEKRVQQLLQDKINSSGLQAEFGEVIVPTVDERIDAKRVVKKKTFPGYILVCMHMSTENWHIVKGIPRVTGFVGGNNPVPISEKDVRAMLDLAKQEAPRLAAQFIAGDKVEVLDGPFSGYAGVVDEVNVQKERVRVIVRIFGRDTAVDLGYFQIKRL